MELKKRFIYSNCLTKLQKSGKIPMLFIGSGLSKRYLKNYPSWQKLISEIAYTIGISDTQLLAMKQKITDINPSETIGKINAEIGSNLAKIFRDKVISGEIELSKIFTDEEIKFISDNNITFVKMLISKKLSDYEITDNPKYLSELSELKKLQSSVGAIVTTNYDKFIEKDLFNNFDVFVEQSQYYMTECTGIGEIYKIHGSVESPNSIIFSTEDYNNFRNNLKVIAAKLLNLTLEYPIIFIGYSLEDENVLEILYTLVDSLTEAQLKILSDNLIYVNWSKRENFLKETEKNITRDGKTLNMTCIDTDNYFVLYKHLQKFMPSEKPERVRKYKKMIRKLIIKSNSGQATIIANDNLDKLNNSNKLVVAFGEFERFAHMGVIGITTNDIIKWVLEQKKDISKSLADSIFKEFYLSTKISSSHYVPMFYILKFCDNYANDTKLLNMKNNLQNWVNKINTSINDLYSFNELKNNPNNLSNYKYICCIVKSYYNNIISYNECLELLNELNSIQSRIKDSNFRKAISYLDMKDFCN